MIYDSPNTGQSGLPPKGRVFFQNIARLLPHGVITWLFERSKEGGLVTLRQNRAEAHRVARKLIELKREELKAETSQRDVLSLLGSSPQIRNCEGVCSQYWPVKSSTALRQEWRLNDEEIVAQVRTIIFAGHETTAKTVGPTYRTRV
jgi:cytochrome P450